MKAKNFFFILLFSLLILQSNAFPAGEKDLIGTWNYKAEGAPPEYASGQIVIQKKDNVWNAHVLVNAQKFTSNQISVSGNKISFYIYIQGEQVKVQLVTDNKTLSGEAVSSNGTIPLTGKKAS